MEAVREILIFSIANPFGVLARHVKNGFLHIHDHFVPHPRNNYIPHVLGHRSLGLFSLLLLSVKVATIALVTAGPVLPAYSSAITTSNIFSLTNQSRQANGLGSLTYNQLLASAAENKAKALAECSCFSHNLPDGRTPWDFIKAQKYNYVVAGENLAVDFTQAESVDEAWMNSPGHRANILNKNYEEIGVGIAQGVFQGHATTFVVQMFGTPLSQPIKTLDTPTLVAAQNKVEPAPEIRPVAAPKAAAPAPAQIAAEPIQIIEGNIELKDGQAKIIATTAGQVSKVTANFNGEAIILQPKSDTQWEGYVELSKLTENNKTVSLTAFDISGKTAGKVLAGFSADPVSNYTSETPSQSTQITLFGRTFDPRALESRFYLIFAGALLTCLVIAIAIRRHVQHVSMVANASFAAIFAMLFMMT